MLDKTWAVLKTEIDPYVMGQARKRASELLALANDALVMLATIHTGIASSFEITAEGDSQFTLPDNIVESNDGAAVAGVYDDTNAIWLSKAEFLPMEDTLPGYFVWPAGTLNIVPTPTSGYTYTVYYIAYFAEIVDDTTIISLPNWMFEAVKLYTASRLMLALSTDAALIAQFKTRVDSGNPEDNPILQESKQLMKEFETLINSIPTYQRDKL